MTYVVSSPVSLSRYIEVSFKWKNSYNSSPGIFRWFGNGYISIQNIGTCPCKRNTIRTMKQIKTALIDCYKT